MLILFASQYQVKKRAILVTTYHIVKLREGGIDRNDRKNATGTELCLRMASDQVMSDDDTIWVLRTSDIPGGVSCACTNIDINPRADLETTLADWPSLLSGQSVSTKYAMWDRSSKDLPWHREMNICEGQSVVTVLSMRCGINQAKTYLDIEKWTSASVPGNSRLDECLNQWRLVNSVLWKSVTTRTSISDSRIKTRLTWITVLSKWWLGVSTCFRTSS